MSTEKEQSPNEITAEFNITEKEVNKDIRIINSFEETIRTHPDDFEEDEINNNEEEIKQCSIIINNKQIPFSYFHKFEKEGKHLIKYIFPNKIKKTLFMFSECKSLTNIDFSNFDSSIVNDISYMFNKCGKLNNINLAYFNTSNVTDMNSLFYECFKLNYVDLSSFNTSNVEDMSYMFYSCIILNNINLSNFNTINVIDMSHMFDGCLGLNDINISNFNTINVTVMSSIFYERSIIWKINLSILILLMLLI